MSELKNKTECFDKLTKDFGFRQLYGVSDNSFLGWVKEITPESGVYAYIHAYKSKNSGYFSDFWIAPASVLDNSLTNTSLCFGVRISEDWDNDNYFYERCLTRIERMMPDIFSAESIVKKELNNPSYVAITRKNSEVRDSLYLAELALLDLAVKSEWVDSFCEEVLFSWRKKKRVFKSQIVTSHCNELISRLDSISLARISKGNLMDRMPWILEQYLYVYFVASSKYNP